MAESGEYIPGISLVPPWIFQITPTGLSASGFINFACEEFVETHALEDSAISTGWKM